MKTFFWTSMVRLLALVAFWVGADYFSRVREVWALVIPQSVVETLFLCDRGAMIDEGTNMMISSEGELENLTGSFVASGDVESASGELLIDDKEFSVERLEPKISTGIEVVVVENVPLLSGGGIPLQEQLFDTEESRDLSQEQELQYWKSRVQILEYYLMTLLQETYQTKGGSQLSLPILY